MRSPARRFEWQGSNGNDSDHAAVPGGHRVESWFFVALCKEREIVSNEPGIRKQGQPNKPVDRAA